MADGLTVEDVRIRICDSQWNPLGELDEWTTVEVTRRVCDVGRGKADAAATANNRALVKPGATVLVDMGGSTYAGLIDPLGEDQPVTASTVRISWSDANAYLARDQAVSNPTTATGQGPNEYDLRSGLASTVVRGYVADNIGQDALPERRAPGLVVRGDPKIGGWLEDPVEARFDNLLDLCRQIAMPNGIVFYIVTTDRGHEFRIREMRDLSTDAQFSRKLGNLAAGSWSWSAPKATRLRAMGKGEGVDRLILVVSTTESRRQEAVWGGPYWAVHDSPSASPGSLRAEALRKLSESGETVSVKYDLSQSGLRYGHDYLEGDIVSVQPDGMDEPVKKPVREVTQQVTSAGYTVSAVVGDYQATSSTGARYTTRQIIRRVEQLEHRR